MARIERDGYFYREAEVRCACPTQPCPEHPAPFKVWIIEEESAERWRAQLQQEILKRASVPGHEM